MKDVIRWVHTPKCNECIYHSKVYKKCLIKQCLYPAKNWTGNNLVHVEGGYQSGRKKMS